MNNLSEKKRLIQLAKMLGQEPDPILVEEVEKEEKRINEERLAKAAIIEKVKVNARKDISEMFSGSILVDEPPKPKVKKEEPKSPAIDLIQKSVDQIKRQEQSKNESVSFSQPNPPIVAPEINAMQAKIKHLEQWLGKISAHGPGSGEVNFRWLDDVNRASINDNWVLEYDATSNKFQFTNEIGPIEAVIFDTNHIDDHTTPGTLCWNQSDKTLNLSHFNGVKQQIGQESYILSRNRTGNTIINGTFVRFAGAEVNGTSLMLIEPFLADGTYANFYGVGLATQDILDDGDGFVTVFGKVRGLNTTGSDVGEVWVEGDILYGNPAIAGKLTKFKPTAPNNVIPVCAVIKVHLTDGEVFVRPTFEQKMLYGRFSDTTNQAPPAIDTPYAVSFNTTNISNGFIIGSPTSRIYVNDSGFYQFDVTLSLTSTNSAAKAFYYWIRKNGVDVPYTGGRQSIVGNGIYQAIIGKYDVSLIAGDYIEIMYAANDLAVSITSPPATAFAPAIPSATLSAIQIAL